MAKEEAGLDLKRQKQCSLVIIFAVKLAGDQQHEEKHDENDEEEKNMALDMSPEEEAGVDLKKERKQNRKQC